MFDSSALKTTAFTENAKLSVFVKMDIEGSEYDTLPQFVPYLDNVNGMVIEFHNIDKYEKQFLKILDDFENKFYIAHVHGCNFAGLIENTNIPKTLEITFLNKKLVEEKKELSRKKYPIKGLDFPDNVYRKDYVLHFDE